MAQLYKMTLYVCDLEDSLSLDEIKTLIEQDALNGISVVFAILQTVKSGKMLNGTMILI